jgi:hypothetical protein
MAPILTPEDVVKRIAAECAFVDERGAVGIRLEPAAAIVRQYGEQFPRPRERRQAPRASKPPKSDRRCSGKSAERALFLNLGAKSLNIRA